MAQQGGKGGAKERGERQTDRFKDKEQRKYLVEALEKTVYTTVAL